MTFGLLYASYNLPELQAVKLTFHWVRGISEISNRNFKILLNGKRPLPLLINPSNLRILLLSQIT